MITVIWCLIGKVVSVKSLIFVEYVNEEFLIYFYFEKITHYGDGLYKQFFFFFFSVSSVVHLCCAGIVMKLYPFEPSVVYPIMELWFQENREYESSAKLMSQWILLRKQLNKEMGVT